MSSISAAGPGRFEATWESLQAYECPEWFRDAKFGIYFHWGVYSVPAYGSEWYPRNMYDPEKPEFRFHSEEFGDPAEFGYKDFIPEFTAPKFDADEWVGLMHEAGARFGGICLVHHDGFLLWESKVSRWNSKTMGPKRDVYGEIAAAVRSYDGMKLLATFHHARSFGYCTGSMKSSDITDEMRRTWDVFDPKYADFYWNEETGTTKEFSNQWKAKVTEVIARTSKRGSNRARQSATASSIPGSQSIITFLGISSPQLTT